MIAIMDTMNEMGNGKRICNMIIMAMDIDSQIREYHIAGLYVSAIVYFRLYYIKTAAKQLNHFILVCRSDMI